MSWGHCVRVAFPVCNALLLPRLQHIQTACSYHVPSLLLRSSVSSDHGPAGTSSCTALPRSCRATREPTLLLGIHSLPSVFNISSVVGIHLPSSAQALPSDPEAHLAHELGPDAGRVPNHTAQLLRCGGAALDRLLVQLPRLPAEEGSPVRLRGRDCLQRTQSTLRLRPCACAVL